MKKKILIILLIALLFSSGSIVFGWFISRTSVDLDFKGSVVTSYFHCGTGTEDDPYVITRPVHLYNLTMLYQKLEGFDEEQNYFQVGYDLDNDGDLEVYNYNDAGELQTGYGDTINMARYTDFVPIGTTSHPFKGIFNGGNFTIKNLIVNGAGEEDIGVFGYVKSDAAVFDVYLKDITINVDDLSSTSEINYIGYIAGNIEDASKFSNVYVNDCEVVGRASRVQSDWGYFGYCANAASLDAFVAAVLGTGQGNEWGGSVNMKNMYDRLYDIAGSATTRNNYAFEKDILTQMNGDKIERNALTGYAYTYRSQKEGSFVFSRYSAQNGARSNFMYLNGGTRYHQLKEVETTSNSGYYISYNGHYLGVNGTNIADHQDAWLFENNRLSITINDTTYYLTHNLTLSTTSTDTWTRNNNRLSYSGSGWFASTYYLTYSNGWTTSTSRTNLTFASAPVTIISEVSNGADYLDYTGTNVTYFPLITGDDSYNVAAKNTGYVIGGSEDNTTNAYPDKTGDIRVSKYSTSDISESYSGGTLRTVYTISDNLRTTTIDESDYVKYSESKAGFLNSISGGNVYGLHFMPANINKQHLVTADYALINEEEKYNYQMPASSIDFNLKEKGFINFFAGTYFSGNNSFFSLHHIERDEEDKIVDIKEIAEIYGSSDKKKNYIYKYTDDSYTDTLTSDYSLAFSTARIKKQGGGITTDAVYYFEIPVNDGEYALGSVDGGTGAYLMYLDIGASGVEDTNLIDDFETIEYRDMPQTTEHTIFVFQYQQMEETDIDIKVSYNDATKTYDTWTNHNTAVKLGILSADYHYRFNDEDIGNTIGIHNRA